MEKASLWAGLLMFSGSFFYGQTGNIMAKPTNRRQLVSWILFIGYLVVMTYFMFFSDGFGRSGHTEYAYNLELFKEIKRFYHYRELVGMKAFLLNIVGNVICFIPFGFILPIISRRGKHWYNTFLLSFLFSLGIETVQLIFKVGSFDVDDMFLNTTGGITGYLLVTILTGAWRLRYDRKHR